MHIWANDTNWRSTAHQSNFSTWPALPLHLTHLGAAEKHNSILGTLKVEKKKGQGLGWIFLEKKTWIFLHLSGKFKFWAFFTELYLPSPFFVTFSGSVQYERHGSLNGQHEWMWKASVYISSHFSVCGGGWQLYSLVGLMSCIVDQLKVLICIV